MQYREIPSKKNSSCEYPYFLLLFSYIKLELARSNGLIVNWYQIKKELFTDAIRKFISSGITGLDESEIAPELL